MNKRLNYKPNLDLAQLRKISTLLLFMSVIMSFAKGQSNADALKGIDSLRYIYEHSSNDSLSLHALSRMARMYRFVDLDTAKHYLRLSLALHKRKNINGNSRALSYNVISDIYKLEPNLDSAKYYYNEAYQTFKDTEDTWSLLAIVPPYADLLISSNEAETGIKMFQDAILLAEEEKDYDNLSYLYLYLANAFYKGQNDNAKAEEFFRKGIEISQQMANEHNFNRITAYLNLGLSNIYIDELKIDSAIICAKRAIKFGNESTLFQQVVLAYNNLSTCYIHLNNYNQAKYFNEKVRALNKDVQNIFATVNTQILTQKLKLLLGDYNSCIIEGNQILDEYSDILSSEIKENVYGYLCDCYIRAGDMQNSLKAKDSFVFHANEVLRKKHQDVLATAYHEYQSKEQKKENELLKSKQEAAEKQLKTQRLAAFGLLAALMLSFTLIIVVGYSNVQSKKHNDQLEEVVSKRTQELQVANKELENTNQELRTLSHIASHDVKEPIRHIGNFVGLIERKITKEKQLELQDDFQIIKNSTNQLYTLIEDFTTYVSYSKNSTLPRFKVNLNDVVHDIKTNLLVLNQHKNGKIIVKDLPVIESNRSAIYLILKNLIENGLKYNKSIQPIVELSCLENNETYEIIIEDNGIGIAPKYHEKVFEMFKRLHNRSVYNGSGIGLSIVRLLSEKLNGEIKIESSDNNGSRLVLSLPKFHHEAT